MKNSIRNLSVALVAAFIAAPSFAASIDIHFDNVATGSVADAAAPAGIHFYQAYYVNDVDAFGDEIPNSEKWQIDSASNASTPVTVDNPASFGYGAAVSGNNALNALWQPVLMHFDSAKDLSAFSLMLDNSHFGDLAQSSLFFLDASKNVISQVLFDQTVPGAWVGLSASLYGVSDVLLPSGAFYDDIHITEVPLPASLPLLLSGLVMMGLVKRRKVK